MSRALTAGMDTAIAAENGVAIQLIEFGFSTGTYRVCTGASDISWNSNTYVGVGGSVACERVSETPDFSGWGADIVMSGVSAGSAPPSR